MFQIPFVLEPFVAAATERVTGDLMSAEVVLVIPVRVAEVAVVVVRRLDVVIEKLRLIVEFEVAIYNYSKVTSIPDPVKSYARE